MWVEGPRTSVNRLGKSLNCHHQLKLWGGPSGQVCWMEGLEVCQTPHPASEVSLPKVGRATDAFPASRGDAACWILGGLHLSATVVAHGSLASVAGWAQCWWLQETGISPSSAEFGAVWVGRFAKWWQLRRANGTREQRKGPTTAGRWKSRGDRLRPIASVVLQIKGRVWTCLEKMI